MEPPSPYAIQILDELNVLADPARTEERLAAAADALQLPVGEISFRITSDDEVRRLNRDFRALDQVTDVLTFPAGPMPAEVQPALLGDVAIAAGQAQRQAAARGIPLEDEIGYLGLHGLLHLAGLDDATEDEREVMIAEMARLGELVGLAPVAGWHTMAAPGGESK